MKLLLMVLIQLLAWIHGLPCGIFLHPERSRAAFHLVLALL